MNVTLIQDGTTHNDVKLAINIRYIKPKQTPSLALLILSQISLGYARRDPLVLVPRFFTWGNI
jgi:hypothetical protein